MSEQHQTVVISQALEKAVFHHNAGQLTDAQTIYHQILETNPNQPVALHLLGVIDHQLGNNVAAVERITRALSIQPDYAEAHSNLGLALQDLGRMTEAVACYQQSIVLKPDYTNAHNNLGNALTELGQTTEAVNSYCKALKLKPDHTEARYNLGLALHKIGRLEEAIICYNKTISRYPNFALAYNNMGLALQDANRLDEAIICFQKTIDINPTFGDAHNNLVKVLTDLGQHQEAITHCQEIIRNRPNGSEGYYSLGTVLQDLEDMEPAADNYRKALDLHTIYTSARTNLLECVYTIGNKEVFYHELKKIMLEDQTDRGVAAISAFASNQFECPDPYPFCNQPLDFISVKRIDSETDKRLDFVQNTEEQILKLPLDEKSQAFLESGIQSSGNLFSEPSDSLANLSQILHNEILEYLNQHKESNCLYIKKWPSNYTLKGWYILMEQGGHLKGHNHTQGWLSGVIYLKVPEKEGNDGSIEFSLHGKELPILDPGYPKKMYRVSEGDIIMFPSSLFHRTTPFYSDSKRLCIAFDMVPVET